MDRPIALLLQAVITGEPPQVSDGTDMAMKDAMMRYLGIYDLTGEIECNLIGMGFDATSANPDSTNRAATLQRISLAESSYGLLSFIRY